MVGVVVVVIVVVGGSVTCREHVSRVMRGVWLGRSGEGRTVALTVIVEVMVTVVVATVVVVGSLDSWSTCELDSKDR